MISAISGENPLTPSIRESSPLDSSGFAALIAALFAQLDVAAPPAEPSVPDALEVTEAADAREPSAGLIESAAALDPAFGALAAAPPLVAPAQAPAPDASTPAGVAAPPALPRAAAPALPGLPSAAAPAQLPPALRSAAVSNNPEGALGGEPATASEVATVARELASSAPAERAQRESAPVAAEPAPAQPAVVADASERNFEQARERETNRDPQVHARVSYGASLEHGPQPRALFPKPTPELGLEPVPRDATTASPAALRAEGSAAPALYATDRSVAQQAVAPNSGPILERIAWLAEQGGGVARLRLDPPALGELEIVVRVRGRRVDVHLRAEEAGAQQAVLESRERLVEALAVKEFRVDEFSVGVGSRERSESGSGEPARERMAPPPHSRAQTPAPAPDTARATATRQATAGSIDLRV